jgi:hypothetical protein
MIFVMLVTISKALICACSEGQIQLFSHGKFNEKAWCCTAVLLPKTHKAYRQLSSR